MTTTIVQAFRAAVRRDPATPLLTWYDDASGDRTELSGATLDNWVSKTANMFVDGAGLGDGDTVAVLLPPHWQTAAVLLGAWSAGLTVLRDGPPRPVEALFSTPDRVDAATWSAGDRYVTGLLPLAMPLREVPPGAVDYVTEVRNYGDHFAGPFGAAAAEPPDLRINAGDRVLIDAAAHPDPAEWLLAPLVAGASIVLCGNLDPAKVPDRAAAEKVTLTLR